MEAKPWFLDGVFAILALCVPASAGAGTVTSTETAKLILSNGKNCDEFGYAVAVDGDTLVVTSQERAMAGPNNRRGAAYVYRRSGSSWSLEQRLESTDLAKQDFFGFSAALCGGTLLIGSPGDDNANAVDAGSAYVFMRAGTVWTQQSMLIASDGATFDQFGYAVDIDGDTAIVGAGRASSGGVMLRGAAYIYVRTGTQWTQQAKLDGHPLAFLAFGADVAVDGDRVVASAPNAQWVYVFERTGTVWNRTARLEPDTPATRFGDSIDLDGDTILVGAYRDDFAGSSAGSVFSFVYDGTAWSQEQRIVSASPFVSQLFGYQVALQGDWAVATAKAAPTTQMDDAIHVLRRDAGVWCDVGSFMASDTFLQLDFGSALAFDGSTVVAGATRADGVVTNTGAGYVHVLDLPSESHCTGKVNSEGCTGVITWTGTPSFATPSPFEVGAGQVVANENGLYFYGLSGPAAVAFEGGLLCVQPPLRRTGVQSSGGMPGVPCDGTFTFDFNAWLQAGNEPLVGPGTQVDGQYWYRDTGDPMGVGLTDALRFFIGP